jgi:Tfp pilus assembly protein FimT
MEIVLVLALLIILGSVVWMQLKAPWESVRLRSAGSLIQSEFGRTRVRAMRTGQTQTFQFQTGGNTYSCQSWQGPGDDQNSMNVSTGFGAAQPTAQSAARPWTHQGELPENIEFLGAETQADTRASLLLGNGTGFSVAPPTTNSSGDAAGGTPSAPILFYPDGTTSTTHVVLMNKRQQCVVVSLRGITGQTRVSEVKALNEVR